jgi:hypothetical protein
MTSVIFQGHFMVASQNSTIYSQDQQNIISNAINKKNSDLIISQML